MKLQPDKSDTQVITGYGAGWVSVGFFVDGKPTQEKLTHSFVVGSHGERLDFPGISFDQLAATHFEQLAAMKPELVILMLTNLTPNPTLWPTVNLHPVK